MKKNYLRIYQEGGEMMEAPQEQMPQEEQENPETQLVAMIQAYMQEPNEELGNEIIGMVAEMLGVTSPQGEQESVEMIPSQKFGGIIIPKFKMGGGIPKFQNAGRMGKKPIVNTVNKTMASGYSATTKPRDIKPEDGAKRTLYTEKYTDTSNTAYGKNSGNVAYQDKMRASQGDLAAKFGNPDDERIAQMFQSNQITKEQAQLLSDAYNRNQALKSNATTYKRGINKQLGLDENLEYLAASKMDFNTPTPIKTGGDGGGGNPNDYKYEMTLSVTNNAGQNLGRVTVSRINLRDNSKSEVIKNWDTTSHASQINEIAAADPSGRFKRALANMQSHTGTYPLSKEMFEKIKDL
jgi:hypothetical protein